MLVFIHFTFFIACNYLSILKMLLGVIVLHLDGKTNIKIKKGEKCKRREKRATEENRRKTEGDKRRKEQQGKNPKKRSMGGHVVSGHPPTNW